jgi:hypothetical protein
MEMNHEDFGPEALADSGDFPSGASAPDRDQEVPPEIEVIEPELSADAKGQRAASISETLSIDLSTVSAAETLQDRQGVHTRTRVVVACSRRLAITFEQSWR